MIRFIEWQSEVATAEGQHNFLQELQSFPDLAHYARGKDLPPTRIGAYLVAHPELQAQARSAVEWFVHQAAVEVVELADELVDEELTAERLNVLERAVKHRTEGRKWLASKWLRPVYGDKVEHSGSITLTHEQQLEQLK